MNNVVWQWILNEVDVLNEKFRMMMMMLVVKMALKIYIPSQRFENEESV